MKTFKAYILLGLAVVALSSCDRFLSTGPLDMKAYDAIDWTDQSNIDEHLYDILDDWIDLRSYFYMDALTDIAYCNDATLGFRTIGLGYATPANPGYNFYDYSKIIKCNRFLKEFEANKEILKEWVLDKYGDGGWNFRGCDVPLQARFVRAWCYLKMLCLYGKVPLILEDTPEGAAVPAASRKEIVDFLMEEADFFLGEAWNKIPDNWRNTTYKDAFPYHRGWVNKFGAAMLGLRIQMYAAAYYGDSDIWKKIVQISDGLIAKYQFGQLEHSLFPFPNMDGEYTLELCKDEFNEAYAKYGQSWYQVAYYNNYKFANAGCPDEVFLEYVLTPGECASKINLKAFYPASDGGASSCVPTMRLMESFGMLNGQPVYIWKSGEKVLNVNSGFDPEHPFKNRDTRFYETLLMPYGFWRDTVYNSLDRYLSEGGETVNADYCLYSANSSKTALGWKKFIDSTVPAKDATISRIPVFRLAELYLIYAEARGRICNTAQDLRVKGDCGLSAIDAVKKLRERVSVENFQPEFLDTPEHFLQQIFDERIVEFAGEGLRVFDLARYSQESIGHPAREHVKNALTSPVGRFACEPESGDRIKYSHRYRTQTGELENKYNPVDIRFMNYSEQVVEEKHFPDPSFFSIPIPQAAYDANPALYDVD